MRTAIFLFLGWVVLIFGGAALDVAMKTDASKGPYGRFGDVVHKTILQAQGVCLITIMRKFEREK